MPAKKALGKATKRKSKASKGSPRNSIEKVVKTITTAKGVYALCDLDGKPLYVGKSRDGIRTRVRRHLTSARSDVIANRMLDIWEIAYVWAWPISNVKRIDDAERLIFNQLGGAKLLLNVAKLSARKSAKLAIPPKLEYQILSDELLRRRRAPDQRFPRMLQQLTMLVDYILNVKDMPLLRQAVSVHFNRINRHRRAFSTSTTP